MAFSVAGFGSTRPLLWHTTHRLNLASIRTSRWLLPALDLGACATDTPRRGPQVFNGRAVLHDQDPLREDRIVFEGGWTMREWLAELDRRVFFWPGSQEAPNKPGAGALRRYRATDVVLRVPFAAITTDHTPEFAACNSGAPNPWGELVRRGPGTFTAATACAVPPHRVVEVTFLGPVALPSQTEVRVALDGPWEPL